MKTEVYGVCFKILQERKKGKKDKAMWQMAAKS